MHPEIVTELVDVANPDLPHRDARLERMRAGHVRHRKPRLVLPPRGATRRDVAVYQIESLIGDLDVVLAHTRLALVKLIDDVSSDAAFEQNARGSWIRPGGARQVVRIVVMRPGCFRCASRPGIEQIEHARSSVEWNSPARSGALTRPAM